MENLVDTGTSRTFINKEFYYLLKMSPWIGQRAAIENGKTQCNEHRRNSSAVNLLLRLTHKFLVWHCQKSRRWRINRDVAYQTKRTHDISRRGKNDPLVIEVSGNCYDEDRDYYFGIGGCYSIQRELELAQRHSKQGTQFLSWCAPNKNILKRQNWPVSRVMGSWQLRLTATCLNVDVPWMRYA